jgi:hypothetical protein
LNAPQRAAEPFKRAVKRSKQIGIMTQGTKNKEQVKISTGQLKFVLINNSTSYKARSDKLIR